MSVGVVILCLAELGPWTPALAVTAIGNSPGCARPHCASADPTTHARVEGRAITGQGYWLVGSDGGLFTFGDAGYYGSEGTHTLNKPIVGVGFLAGTAPATSPGHGGAPPTTGPPTTSTTTTVPAPSPPPKVILVNPVSGPSGTLVTVSGSNLTGATAVDFGTVPATSFTVNNATTITATVPAGSGTVNVTVVTASGTSATSANDQFTYGAGTSPAAIPSPVAGGWQLNGSATLMTSATPPNLQLTSAMADEAGSAFWPTPVAGVGITAAFDASIGSGTGGDGLTFTLADASANSPSALGLYGGGEGFSGITGVAVSLDTYQNSVNPSANFVGVATGPGPVPTSLNYATTNSSIAPLRDTVHHFVVTTFATGLSVTMDGSPVLSFAAALPPLVYVGFTGGTGEMTDIHAVQNVAITAGTPPPAPAVAGVSPSSGPTTGGTPVVITGTNFTGASEVDFGAMAAPSFTVNSPTQITTTSSVLFGSNAAVSFTVNSTTSITATSPTGTGTTDVTVVTTGGTSATSGSDRYTYTVPPQPAVTGLSPSSGPIGTAVTVTGTNLTGATAVNFAGVPATTFTVAGPTTITATSPAGTGTGDVTVTTSGGTSAKSASDQYTYAAGTTPLQTVMYRGDLGRSGYYPAETGLTTANVANLKMHWTDGPGAGVNTFAQPIVADNMVFWSDWTGNEHGTTLSGTDVWTTNIGTDTPPTADNCAPASAGPTSTPTMATEGGTTVLYVAGANGVFYALNAANGAVIWQTQIAVPPNSFVWDSPALYNGTIYIGVASYGDCPLVQGKLLALNAATGAITATADMVSTGCVGGGIWSSPTIDTTDGSIWVTTGTPNYCESGDLMAPAIIKLRSTDLTILGYWTVPVSAQAAGDADFGSTPTLFTATIGGQLRSLVGAANKNGIFYAFDRTNPAAGPVWQSNVAYGNGGPAEGTILSAAWDGTNLYVGGGNTTVKGQACNASLGALNPATGAFVWQDCEGSYMYGGITAVPGIVIEGQLGYPAVTGSVQFLNAATGATLYSFAPTSGQPGYGQVQGEVAASNGIVYVPLDTGYLLALGP